ncbi:MAG: sugar ABC transporter permease [Actinobacteria bacterium]|nr:sugar ABC transporter permease [Actinomycetota bacterium]
MTATLDASERPAEIDKPVNTRRRRKLREAGLGYSLLVPALIIFGIFIFYPFIKNFILATHQVPPFPGLPEKNVGLDQFGDVLGSRDFLDSLWITVLFALMTVPTGIALGLGLAILAHQKLKGIAIFRTIFSSTVATSVAVASVMFYTLFNPNIGLLKSISPTPPFLENPGWALIAIAIVTIWQNLGLSFILMSAGLQAIPDELVEAAQVDGAGPWSRFRNVTLPLLSPTVFFAVVVGTIFAFQTFGQIDILTEGGPLGKTKVLTYAIYEALRQPPPNPGKAAVLAIALFAITLVLTMFQMRFLERRVHYQR